jgi:hypothetical protein
LFFGDIYTAIADELHYLQKKDGRSYCCLLQVSIPLDAPRKQVDYSPIRSGLRKRRRVESPVQAEPRVEESWIDEQDLELWEIKAYRSVQSAISAPSPLRLLGGGGGG